MRPTSFAIENMGIPHQYSTTEFGMTPGKKFATSSKVNLMGLGKRFNFEDEAKRTGQSSSPGCASYF
jgi:hypothetical protein